MESCALVVLLAAALSLLFVETTSGANPRQWSREDSDAGKGEELPLKQARPNERWDSRLLQVVSRDTLDECWDLLHGEGAQERLTKAFDGRTEDVSKAEQYERCAQQWVQSVIDHVDGLVELKCSYGMLSGPGRLGQMIRLPSQMRDLQESTSHGFPRLRMLSVSYNEAASALSAILFWLDHDISAFSAPEDTKRGAEYLVATFRLRFLEKVKNLGSLRIPKVEPKDGNQQLDLRPWSDSLEQLMRDIYCEFDTVWTHYLEAVVDCIKIPYLFWSRLVVRDPKYMQDSGLLGDCCTIDVSLGSAVDDLCERLRKKGYDTLAEKIGMMERRSFDLMHLQLWEKIRDNGLFIAEAISRGSKGVESDLDPWEHAKKGMEVEQDAKNKYPGDEDAAVRDLLNHLLPDIERFSVRDKAWKCLDGMTKGLKFATWRLKTFVDYKIINGIKSVGRLMRELHDAANRIARMTLKVVKAIRNVKKPEARLGAAIVLYPKLLNKVFGRLVAWDAVVRECIEVARNEAGEEWMKMVAGLGTAIAEMDFQPLFDGDCRKSTKSARKVATGADKRDEE